MRIGFRVRYITFKFSVAPLGARFIFLTLTQRFRGWANSCRADGASLFAVLT